jgi:hypothetical protein
MKDSHLIVQRLLTTTQTAAGEFINTTVSSYSNHDGTAVLMLIEALTDDDGNEIGPEKMVAVTLDVDQMLALADRLTRFAGR